jgi:hypothetical protein
MNWSMITCAPLTKSPNWASQSTRPSGLSSAVAVLEAEHTDLRERAVVDLEGAWSARASSSGDEALAVFERRAARRGGG